jgi:PAS domain S-box-containing protein
MSTRAKTTLGFALACLVIFIAIISSNISTSKLIEDNQWLNHTLEVRSQIETFQSHFLTAQNNMRGFIMSDQSYYLEKFSAAKIRMQDNIVSLRQLTKDNPAQIENLNNLERLLNIKLNVWANLVNPKNTSSKIEEKNLLLSDETKQFDEAFFSELDKLLKEENRVLNFRQAQTVEQEKRARFISLASGFLACALIILAAFLVYRDSQRREAAESEIERFFTLSLDLLCISGMDGYFKRLSPSYSQVLGYSLKELYSRPILEFVHPDDIEKTQNEIANQKKGNKVLSFENRFRCADGSYRIFSWKSTPVDQFMFAVARDVTPQKEFEKELVEAREAAQKGAMAKSSFLANMSHEIRTPLNGVVGMTDILARTPLDVEQKKFVGAIRSSAASLIKIVNEILDFSKIEAGHVHLEKSEFDLSQLIEEHVSLLGVLAFNKGLKIETMIDPQIPPVVIGDSGKIGQILLNFVSNAIKFTEDGQITIIANCLSLTETECRIRLGVQDTGIGILDEKKDSLFKPFVQADSSTSRRFGGTGLGLSICKRFAEIMNGKIGVDSVPSQGSTFWIEIDLGVSKLKRLNSNLFSEADSNVQSPIVDERLLGNRKKFRILIAEDNKMNQLIVMNMMSILGYSATLAENGEDAFKAFSEEDFDLILMDQHMPVMDGVESSRQIRQRENGSSKHVPIIAFTATVLQDEQKIQYKNLFDDFILKPVSLDILEATLVKWQKKLS